MDEKHLERVLKDLKVSKHNGIVARMSRSQEFCKALLWLAAKFKKQDYIHPKEMSEFFVFTEERARQVLKGFMDMGFIKKRERGIIIEYIPLKNNDHMMLDNYVSSAMRLCELNLGKKTSRLDEFKPKRGMK